MDNKLPIYKATVTNEETGIYCISLVDDPAVEKDWLYFNEDKKPMTFAVQDEEKRIIRGLIMECDKLIYRRDDSGYEFDITFDAKTIRTLAQKYLKDGFQNNVDTMHNDQLVDGVELVQWFISDKENGINPAGFEDVADHSLFAEFHVLNDDIWNSVKDGTFKGFSLAGIFEPVKVEMQKNNNKTDNKKMSKLNKVREMLQSILAQFERLSTDNGLLSFDGDELEVGMSVNIVDEEGNESPAPDGEYKDGEGVVYVIKEGKVEEIREPDGTQEDETTGDDVQPENEVPEENAEEEPSEEQPAEEPEADPRDEQIANLEAEVARLEEELGALRAENDELKARIKELEEKPAADAPTEEFERVNKVEKTGNRQLDNLTRILNA